MGFCEYIVKDGIFVLTLDGGDGGHNYLTEQSIAELHEKLKEIRGRARPSSKGLVTTSAGGGSFCDGVDYGQSTPPLVADELGYRMAEVVRELLGMPFPTVAAVTGDVRTSLALALVLAHDSLAAMKDVRFEVKEVRDGHDNLPRYVAALLRDKSGYPTMRSSMVLQARTMAGSDMNYWYMVESWIDSKEGGGVVEASGIITNSIGDVRDGQAYITTRKSFFPESWKAVSEFLGDKQ